MPDVNLRLIFYKRLASTKNEAELDSLQIEMIDRFGLLPPPAKHLIAVTEIKQQAEKLGILKIEMGPSSGILLFHKHPQVEVKQLIKLIQQQPQTYKLLGEKLQFQFKLKTPEQKIAWIKQLLLSLQ